MSRPGELTPTELMQVGNGFQLNQHAGPWWIQCAAQLTTAFGFAPALSVVSGVRTGAYRTRAIQLWVNPKLSPDYSNHCIGRSVDIGNQRMFRNKNEKLFIKIVNANGFKFDASGEPWHATCYNTSTPAGGDPVRIDKTNGLDMSEITYLYKTEGGTVYGIFGQEIPGGSYIAASLAEAEALGAMYGTKEASVGGRVGAPWKIMTAAQWPMLISVAKKLADRYFAAIHSGGSGNPEDNGPVLAAIAGVSTQVSQVSVQVTNFPPAPTAAQNGQAARDAIVK